MAAYTAYCDGINDPSGRLMRSVCVTYKQVQTLEKTVLVKMIQLMRDLSPQWMEKLVTDERTGLFVFGNLTK